MCAENGQCSGEISVGVPVDAREYGAAAAILRDLGITRVRLLTNDPDKIRDLEAGGISVARRLPLTTGAAPANLRYLSTKQHRMGHLFDVREIS